MRPNVAIAVTNLFVLLGFLAYIAALLPWIVVGTTPHAVLATVLAAVCWAIALVLGGFSSAARSRKHRFYGDPVKANEELEEAYARVDSTLDQRAAREVNSPRHQAPPD